MSRLPRLERSEMTPEQARAYDEIASGPRGRVAGPLAVWVRIPELADHAQRVGAYCRFGTTLPGDLREFTILIAGGHYRAQFEWWAHEQLALKEGLDPAIIAAVKDGRRPEGASPEVGAIYDFCSELLANNRISDKTYETARALFGDDQLIQITSIIGYYALVAVTLNAFAIPLPDGAEPPFAD